VVLNSKVSCRKFYVNGFITVRRQAQGQMRGNLTKLSGAGYKPAVRQVENLRYGGLKTCATVALWRVGKLR
jgi:hypothetical protein